MRLRQKQETIDSLTETLESREQLKIERELVDQNQKLMEEVNKYRKREHQLNTQLSDERINKAKRSNKLENNDVMKLIMNLNTKKNNIMKDLGEPESRGRGASMSPKLRKFFNQFSIK